MRSNKDRAEFNKKGVRTRQQQVEVKAKTRTGGCFVVSATDGRCWNGSEWVRLWSEATQYEVYEDCEAARVALNEEAHLVYIQLGERPDFVLPRWDGFDEFPTNSGL